MKTILKTAVALVALAAGSSLADNYCSRNGKLDINATDAAKRLYVTQAWTPANVFVGGSYGAGTWVNGAGVIQWNNSPDNSPLYLPLDEPWADAAMAMAVQAKVTSRKIVVMFCFDGAGNRVIDRINLQ